MRTLAVRVALVVLLAASCASEKGAPAPVVLAQGVGFSVTADDYRERANQEAPMTRLALADPTRRREYLEQIVGEELLVAEARRQGLDRTPEFKATVRVMLMQRLFQAHAAAPGTAKGPAEPGQQELERKAWVATLREKAQVEVREAALQALDLAAATPASAPSR